MAVRIFLALSALVWLPYGVLCFAQPGYLAEVAGVAAMSTTATVELRAMYGGLQAAIGLLALLGAMGTRLRHAALVVLVFLCAGLGLSRAIGAILAGEISQYTGFALFFEFASAGLALWFLSRAPRNTAA